jgi:hypothetical protein
MTTYSVVQRSKSNWTRHGDGAREYLLVNHCGHHRTAKAAGKCLDKLATKDAYGLVTPLGYFGRIEDSLDRVYLEDGTGHYHLAESE